MARVAFFGTLGFERHYFDQANRNRYAITYFDEHLSKETAFLAKDHDFVCTFVNDHVDQHALRILKANGIKLIALRAAGFNNVDLMAAQQLGLPIVRVPKYSPNAVAEHAVALILALNRRICQANSRVKHGDFSLDGLVGFDLKDKIVGIIGTGQIGAVMARIMVGFGCHVLAFDIQPNPDLKKIVSYVEDIKDIYSKADIISLHVPMSSANHHMISTGTISLMKHNVMIVNTSRGALIDTSALIDGLKSGKIGYAGLDVYEEEEHYFFNNLSNKVIQDDHLARLMTFQNVIITSHQGFLTHEALSSIAKTVIENINDFEQGKALVNQISVEKVIPKLPACVDNVAKSSGSELMQSRL